MAIALLVCTAGAARAADHADGTAASLDVPDASSDITDLFAWMSSDAKRVQLVLDVSPGAVAGTRFSNAVKYVFHVNSKKNSILDTPTRVNVICSFDAAQKASCWVVDADNKVLDYVTGDASATTGITSASGKLKLFAGRRDDPFFFNLAGFRTATRTVAQAIADTTMTYIKSLDATGCPMLADGVATALLGLLSHDCSGNALAQPPVPGGAAVDFFAKPGANASGAGGCVNQGLDGDVLAIVLSVDKTLLTPSGGPFIGVWASTNK
jgi:hypothetical protein